MELSQNESKPAEGVVQSSWHLTRWGARRARKRWMRSVRGRDAYVRRHAVLHWEARRINYESLKQALATSLPEPEAKAIKKSS